MGGLEYALQLDEANHSANFSAPPAVVSVEYATGRIVNVLPRDGGEGGIVDMSAYFIMSALLKGMLNAGRVHFVNAATFGEQVVNG
jgi:hypothetical protein